MHVFMQIRVHKNAAYFDTLPAYFGYVRVAFFVLLFGSVVLGDWTMTDSKARNTIIAILT